MTNPPDDTPADETPIQKALRLKTAALAAKARPSDPGRQRRERDAAAKSSSKSKPWMSR